MKKVVVLIVVCLLIGSVRAGRAEDRPKGQTAVRPWSLHLLYLANYDTKHRSDEQKAALLKEKGFAGCGYITYVPEDVTLEGRQKSLEKAGLRLVEVFVLVNVNKPLNEDYFRTLMPKLGVAKADCVLRFVGAGHDARVHDDKIVGILKAVSDIARKDGVRIMIYPHSGDVTGTVGHVVDVVKRVNRPGEVGAMFLEYHWRYSDPNQDLKAVLENAKPWLMRVAIEVRRLNSENVDGSADTSEELKKGKKASLLAIYRVLRDLGYQGDIGLEPHGCNGQDLADMLDKSMANWKKIMASP